MEKLSKDLRESIEDGNVIDIVKHLRETAKMWASSVIEHNTGKALEKGLKISQSICDYLDEITE